ncbi:DUF805 domain-containing protein [Weissella minor]|uniref:DUF805 domain-containing protein n=1 Tax=Weissella minor TaxID=1620 RepID=UPI003AF2284B
MEYLLAYLNQTDGFQFGKLFSFKGILDRKSYFLGMLIWSVLVSLIAMPLATMGEVLVQVMMAQQNAAAMQSISGIIFVIFAIGFIVILLQGLAAMSRRLHDAGVSAYKLLYIVVPYLLALISGLVTGISGAVMGGFATFFVVLPFIGFIVVLWHLIKPTQQILGRSATEA